MNFTRFKTSLTAIKPPPGLAPALEALWWDAKGDWTKAHELAQENESDKASAWVHAYLHRVEGDLSNAAWWYRAAGRKAQTGSLKAEWAAMVTELLAAAPRAD